MKPTHYEKIIGTLIQLKEEHPKCTMAKHLSTALDKNFWGMTDKELHEALETYRQNLALDKRHSDDDIDVIIKQGLNLSTILEEDDDE